jgi:hypothetical protein
VFLGSFLTTEAALKVFFEKEFIIQGTTYYATPPADGYKREDIPTVRDAYEFGRLRGTITTTDANGKKIQKVCELADTNCDGKITTDEWRAWAQKNIGQMQDRCQVLNCGACKGNNDCWNRPAGAPLSYNGSTVASPGTNFLYTDMPQWYTFSSYKVSDTFFGRLNTYGYTFINAFNINDPSLKVYYYSDWNTSDSSGGTVSNYGYSFTGGYGYQDASIGTDYNCLSATGC